MGDRELNFQVFYRGESLERFINGSQVLFQRSRQSGGGYWPGLHMTVFSSSSWKNQLHSTKK